MLYTKHSMRFLNFDDTLSDEQWSWFLHTRCVFYIKLNHSNFYIYPQLANILP